MATKTLSYSSRIIERITALCLYFLSLGRITFLNQNWSGSLLVVCNIFSAGKRWTTNLAIQRSKSISLALAGFTTLFTNEFIVASVNYPLVGTDGIFSDGDFLGWHRVSFNLSNYLVARNFNFW